MVRRVEGLGALAAIEPAGDPDMPALLVVATGVKGLAIIGSRLAEVAASRECRVDLVVTPPPVRREQPLRAPSIEVTLLDQVRHRRRWRRLGNDLEPPFDAIAARYAGIAIAGTGPALGLAPDAVSAGVPVAVLADVTMELHAQQNRWQRRVGAGRLVFDREVAHERRLFASIDRVFTVSAWARQSLRDDLGVPEEKSAVMGQVVRPITRAAATTPRPPGPVRLVAIGSPWKRKGLDRVADWLLSRPHVDVELHYFGDAPPNASDPRITVHGVVPSHTLMNECLTEADLLVHATRRDQSANIIAEAAWVGLPSLASSSGGIPELIDHGLTGWLLPDDPGPRGDGALTRALDELVSDRDRLARAGRAARAKAEAEFDADRIFAPVIDWLAGRAPAPHTDANGRPVAPPSTGERSAGASGVTSHVGRGGPNAPDVADVPGVSVIMPALNASATIGDQLVALARNRSTLRWELIVADNGSTDHTLDVVEQHRQPIEAVSGSPVRVIDASSRRGANHARNLAARRARGAILLFCDADDAVGDDWVEQLSSATAQHHNASGAIDRRRYWPGSVDALRRPLTTNLHRTVDGHEFGISANLGVTRTLFDALGGFDPAFVGGNDDTDFGLRATALGHPPHFVPDAVVHYRDRPEWRARFRQYRTYGRTEVQLYRKHPDVLEARGLASGARFLGSAVALFAQSRGQPEHRAAAIDRLARLTGRIEGSIRYRVLFL